MSRCIWALLAVAFSVAAHAAEDCRKLYRLTDFNHAIEPGIEVPATDGVPAHCRVTGVVSRAIRFQVTLPRNWNGKMMFTAVGGAAGQIGDTTSLLARGFAMASTDTGHEAVDGNAFYRQPQALLDYAYRGVHLATVSAKRIIRYYCGDEVEAHIFLETSVVQGHIAVQPWVRLVHVRLLGKRANEAMDANASITHEDVFE